MKTNLRAVALGLSVLSAVVAGWHEQGAKAAENPTVVQVEKAAPAEAPDAQTAPAAVAAPSAAAATPADTNAPASAKVAVKDNAVIPEDLRTSPALTELVRLLQGGVSEEVLMAYITNSAEPFYIGADEILFLHDLGTPTSIITTLIHRDSSPEMTVRKQAAVAVKPLPPGVSLTTPATNLYATASPSPAPPAPAPVADNPPEPTPVTPPLAAPEEPVSVSHFETELAPYGTWVDVGGYGRCWRPTVAVWNASWRPYGDCGRWLWTDAGWYWYSDYSWGWAPFHYGRWACPAGIGWVWAPDTCWGPSWVSWRYSSSYCGWAPLPPSASFVYGHGFYHHGFSVGIGFEFGLGCSDYVFVATSGLCDRRPRYLSTTHSATVFKDTTVANNYATPNKNTVVNKGVGFERVSQATRGNIRQVALKGTTEVRPTTPRRETLDSEGKTLTVSQPPIGPSTAPAANPSANALRPRNDRNAATLAAPTSRGSMPSAAPETTSFSPKITAPRGTYLAPRRSVSSETKPATIESTPNSQVGSATAASSSSGSKFESRSRTAPNPVRGSLARNEVSSGGSSPTVTARPEATGNYTPPQNNAVRGTGPTQVRPNAAVPNASQPSARSIGPSSPRVDTYRAPSAPSAAPRTYSAPVAPPSAAPRTYSAPAASPSAAPRTYSAPVAPPSAAPRSAPAPSSSRSESSTSSGRSSGDGGGGGGRGNR